MQDKVESFTHEGKTVTLFYDQDCTSPREWDGHFLWLGLPHRRYEIGDEQIDPSDLECHTCHGAGYFADAADDGNDLDCPVCEGLGRIDLTDGRTLDGSRLVQWLQTEHDARLVEPVSLYDHSGTSYTLGVSRGWDSGVCGFMVVTSAMLEAWGCDPAITDDELREGMKAELAEYTSWANGDCYGYVATEPGRTAAGIIKDAEVDGTDVLDVLSITADEYDRLCAEPGTEPVELDACWGLIGYDYAVTEAKAAIGMPND